MIKVYNKDTNEFLGRISEAELEFLTAHLESERLEDQDYYIRKETLDIMRKSGASSHLTDLLQGGLKNLPSIEVRWEGDESDNKKTS